MQIQPDNKPCDDINVTPMLDPGGYVLLIIFIVMTTATVQGAEGQPARRHRPRRARRGRRPRRSPSPTTGRYSWTRIPVTLLELEQRARADEGGHSRVSGRAQRGCQTQYQNVMDVLDLLGRLSITQVGACKAAREVCGRIRHGSARGRQRWNAWTVSDRRRPLSRARASRLNAPERPRPLVQSAQEPQ